MQRHVLLLQLVLAHAEDVRRFSSHHLLERPGQRGFRQQSPEGIDVEGQNAQIPSRAQRTPAGSRRPSHSKAHHGRSRGRGWHNWLGRRLKPKLLEQRGRLARTRTSRSLQPQLFFPRLRLLAQADEQWVEASPILPRDPLLQSPPRLLRSRGFNPAEAIRDAVHVRVDGDAHDLPVDDLQQQDCHFRANTRELQQLIQRLGHIAAMLFLQYSRRRQDVAGLPIVEADALDQFLQVRLGRRQNVRHREPMRAQLRDGLRCNLVFRLGRQHKRDQRHVSWVWWRLCRGALRCPVVEGLGALPVNDRAAVRT
mmetsp:Transcript_60900/g.170294  ORF Transcript_60900/g.170294 Transcript_60900/m.170294 type:complete len:310 (+) Transcript_60900:873-1802(+)